MFRIISEAAEPTRVTNRIGPVPTETDVATADVIPFIEVGGPNGPVTSLPMPQETAKKEPPAVEAKPLIRALSVTMHRFAGPTPTASEDADGLTDLIVVLDPTHPASREYAVVADALRGQQSGPGSHVCLFTAEAAASGTTTVLLNLAATFARDESTKVLVIDANFIRPAAAQRIGARDSAGLAEVLDQTVPLTWAIQPTDVTRVHAVAAGQDVPRNPSSLADLPKLMVQLKQWFDWILIDAGAWAESIAADAIAPTVDGVYLVSREDRVDPVEFAELRAAIDTAGGKPRGYVTTRA